jgi:hypothetical protein
MSAFRAHWRWFWDGLRLVADLMCPPLRPHPDRMVERNTLPLVRKPDGWMDTTEAAEGLRGLLDQAEGGLS